MLSPLDEESQETDAERADAARTWALEQLEDGGLISLSMPNALEACARAKLDAPHAWAAITQAVDGSGEPYQARRDWKGTVGTCTAELKRERRELERLQAEQQRTAERERARLERAELEQAGAVTFTAPVDDVKIALSLLEQLEEGTEPLCYDMGGLWRYDPSNGLWGREWEYKEYEGPLSRKVHDFSGAPVYDEGGEQTRTLSIGDSRTSAVIETVCKQRQANHWPAPFFDSAPNGLAFADCYIRANLDDERLEKLEHSPDHRARAGLGFNFDPQAECPMFEEYLESVFKPDDDADAGTLGYDPHADADAKARLVYDFIGAGLLGIATSDYAERAFMLHGAKGTGKSTLLEIIEALFPSGTVSHVNPHEFDDMDAGAALEGTLLNVVHETPESRPIRENGIKAIVQGQGVARRAVYQSRINFHPRALHIFAANRLPSCPGVTDAFWDRWHGLTFNRKFRGTDDQKKGLAQRIIDAELPGIVAGAMNGARRVLEQGGYTMPPSSKRMLEDWKGADPVKIFFEECTSKAGVDVGTKSTWAKASNIWKVWNMWCAENGYKRMNRATFKNRAEQYGYPREKSNCNRRPCKLKPDARELLERAERRQSRGYS